jgi:hypothetical protein
MKRILIAIAAALPLAVGAGASAQAKGWPWPGSGDQSSSNTVMVAGMVQQVNATADTFTAKAVLVPQIGFGFGFGFGFGSGGGSGSQGAMSARFGGGFGGGFPFGFGLGSSGGSAGASSTPTVQTVTITVNSSTQITRDGQSAQLGALDPGDRFTATFSGASSDSLSTVVQSPALTVSAHKTFLSSHQLYAFVGTVTGTTAATSTAPGTVSVNVMGALPSGLVGAGSATFTVGTDTLVLGGSSLSLAPGSLGSVGTGDIIAGGLIGASGLTASQFESTPLAVLIDIPAAVTSTTGTTARSSSVRQDKKKALAAALRALGVKSSTHKRSHKRSHHRKHASSRRG